MTNRRNSRIGSNQSVVQNSLSKDGFHSLSDYRRAEIHDVATKQISKEEEEKGSRTALAVHGTAYRESLVKKATGIQTTLPSTRGLTDMMGPEVYSPLFQLANMNLPRDRITMNAWNRIFYDTHPLVRNAINLHSSYPISKINISHPSKKIQSFFEEMASQIDLYSVVYSVALEYWKHGEAFPYAELDKNSGTWRQITVLNPDYIHVTKKPIGNQSVISLKPDAELRRLISSNSPSDIAAKKRLTPAILDAVKKGKNIPLDNIYVSHLKLLSSPYDKRGTSIITSVYKDLMHYDKIRECKIAQADGMINPLTLVKVGSGSEYRATQADLEAVRDALEQAQYDKDFKLVTHDGITIERIGFSGAVLEVASDIEMIMNNLYIGLMVPKAIIEQDGASYASSSIGLEVLRQRYDLFRNMIKKWLEQKIFAPICELQEFFDYVDGEKILQVPTIDFNHMNLYDMNDYIQNISNFVANKQISLQTLYRCVGIDYKEESRRLKEEAIDEVKKTKELESLAALRLRELESLNADSIIPEPPEGGGGMSSEPPEGLPGLELPGMGGGGAPPGMPESAPEMPAAPSSPPPE